MKLAILPCVLLLLSCASSVDAPKTGDISFRVSWTGEADVDLYVKSPLGEPVNYGHPRVESGGELDIDCNFRGAADTAILRDSKPCDAPMENIYWPRGAAPRGVYEFWLLLPDPTGVDDADLYSLEVRDGREIIWHGEGRVVDLLTTVPVRRVSYPGFVVSPVPTD